ncbi:MAG: tRNA lysidine(34) synthetase TilS [Gammaproteobacteria bacterium]|nr:tRNA lysidine(34) synthetase TilS [Gammaproteobacteria bacterium]
MHADLSAGSQWCVALSGGVDSSALLQALTLLLQEMPGNQVRAIHVNHHLHPESDQWAAACGSLCAKLGIVFSTHDVVVADDHDEGLEAAARRARYRVFEAELEPDERLLTAHHRDDQVETFLLRLMRGAGPQGLASIRQRRSFGRGWLIRPLLYCSRGEIENFAKEHGLTWIDDPANTNTQYDRNFLRHDVLPLLLTRWPGLGETIPRAARLSGEAAMMLDELAELDAGQIVQGNRIAIPPFSALSSPRQRNLLRYVLRKHDLKPPSEVRLREGLAQLTGAGQDRLPVLALAGGQVRRYREHLHVLNFDPDQQTAFRPQRWDGCGRLDLVDVRSDFQGNFQSNFQGNFLGQLYFADPHGGEAAWPAGWEVRYREGGEQIRHGGQRKLVKKLLQERGIVPWMRGFIPLLYREGQLLAIGGVCIADDFSADAPAELELIWTGHPSLR